MQLLSCIFPKKDNETAKLNPMNPTRRDLLKAAATTTTAGILGSASAMPTPPQSQEKFKLHYAPHFGMFRNLAGDDSFDQLKFAADQGFTAWEDNGMMGRDNAFQDKFATTMDDLGMHMGVFVAHAEWSKPMYALGGQETYDFLKQQANAAVETAKRVNAKWMTVVPGPYDLRLDWDYQTANVVDCLKFMAELFEPHGLTMVLEPLNPYRDHPGMFLSKIPQAYNICKAVGSPSCKILDDLYHQQITEGNLIPNLDMAWSEIAYFQVGDNPGRREPLTGEINYRNVFKHIHQRLNNDQTKKDHPVIVGMEHGNSQGGKEGDQKVIDAYRWCDEF